MANNYWEDRLANTQDRISRKNTIAVEKQLRKYYKSTMRQVIEDFESTYDKLLATIEAGRQPTPADLYNLDKYWQLQANLKTKLDSLNARQQKTLQRIFETNFFEVYHSIKLQGYDSGAMFNTIDEGAVQQLINQVWCADGKSWSQRIWENTTQLKQELQDGLIQTIVSGKNPSFLKKTLMERFNVSFSRADALVRTELAHVQTQAAQKRYTDYGIQEVEILVDPDERTCDVCGKLHGKRYPINARMPIPAHPRCRCCIIPVVNIPKTNDK